jgi:hypothetical protein
MPRLHVLLSVLVLCLTSGLAVAQVPGAYPHMTLVNSDGQLVPPPAGPYLNNGKIFARAGTAVEVRMSYAALAQPNTNVLWGLLISGSATPFPKNISPPPLFTQPPFQFLLGPGLDLSGDGSLLIGVPSGLFSGDAFLQGIILDTTASPTTQLSNGVQVTLRPPRFNVAFSFLRAVPTVTLKDFDGVGSLDLNGDELPALEPLGLNKAPPADTTDVGFLPGFRFLPIVANQGDAPINPMARPMTRVTQDVGTVSTTPIRVDDTAGFPPSGKLLISSNSENPYAARVNSGANPPNIEVMSYTSKTSTEFRGIKRKLLGSTGTSFHPHQTGTLVFGEFTFMTTAGAQARQRVGLDVTNPELPHVVLPSTTFTTPGEGAGNTLDQDLYRFQQTNGEQGFAVLDHVTHSWRIIEDSVIVASNARVWDHMISVAPDRRSIIACQRVGGGPEGWDSNPDEIYAIRLDGLDWPASGSPVWQIDFELRPEPSSDDGFIRSREVFMPSVGIVGPDQENFLAYVGLKFKFKQTNQGNTVLQNDGFEGAFIREEVFVRDYVEIPLVPPGSNKGIPLSPRPYINADFGLSGTGIPVRRFDPTPLLDRQNHRMFVAGGPLESVEDIYVVRSIGIQADGEPSRVIQNVSGLGVPGGLGASVTEIRQFFQGGQAQGQKVALSPGGTRIAWLGADSTRRDWILIGATDGSEFSSVGYVYQGADGKFQELGDLTANRVVSGMYFADEDNLVFLMGSNAYIDPLGYVLSQPLSLPGRYDIYRYNISTDTMTNLSLSTLGASDFDNVGEILPAGHFKSPNGKFLFYLRDGIITQGNTSLPPGAPVMNVLAVDLTTFTVFDVTGDENSNSALITNLDLPASSVFSPVESLSEMRFIEGRGVQDGLIYFVAHEALDGTETDKLYAINMNQPFVSFEVSGNTQPGAHITNVTPNPYSSSVAFARTFDDDRFAARQHPIVVDLDNFLFERDLTGSIVNQGIPQGRVMDGSFHFVAPTGGAGDGLIFAAGLSTVNGSEGIAEGTAVVYYPLENLSDVLAEPVPLLIPILDTFALGPLHRLYITGASVSVDE